MTHSGISRPRLAWVVISGLALASSACDGPGMTAPWRHPPRSDPYVALRPPFDANGRKNFYVSGYAGATYGPLSADRAARRAGAMPSVTLGEPRTVVEQGDWPITSE